MSGFPLLSNPLNMRESYIILLDKRHLLFSGSLETSLNFCNKIFNLSESLTLSKPCVFSNQTHNPNLTQK